MERAFFYPKLAKEISKMEIVNEKPVIFDVGANRGQSIRFFRGLFAKCTIYGFEPSSKVFSILSEKFNGVSSVKLFELALGSVSGKGVFFEHLLDETSTMSLPDLDSKWQKTKNRLLLTGSERSFTETIVNVTTIDEFCATHEVSRIDLLKIDVEGFEHEVLKGGIKTLTQGKVRIIQIERHADDLRLDRTPEIQGLLTLLGFHTVISIKHSFGNFYEDFYMLQRIDCA